MRKMFAVLAAGLFLGYMLSPSAKELANSVTDSYLDVDIHRACFWPNDANKKVEIKWRDTEEVRSTVTFVQIDTNGDTVNDAVTCSCQGHACADNPVDCSSFGMGGYNTIVSDVLSRAETAGTNSGHTK